MYLSDLALRASPGLTQPIDLVGLQPGLIILVGPNGSGKSTIGRVLRGTLWADPAPSGVDARTTWRASVGGAASEATLLFGRVTWDPPRASLAGELADNAQLTLAELLKSDAQTDRAIAQRIQTQLDGGYDLTKIGPGDPPPRTRALPRLRKPFEQECERLRRLLSDADHLAERESRLADHERRAAEAAQAPARLEQVKAALRRLDALAERRQHQDVVDALGPRVATLPSNAEQTARELQEAVAARVVDRDRRAAHHKDLCEQAERAKLPAGAPAPEVLTGLQAEADALVASAQSLRALDAEVSRDSGRVQELARQVWAAASGDGLPDRRVIERLSAAAEALGGARARLNALVTAEAPDPGPASEGDRERLIDARSLLRQWLASPRVADAALAAQPPMALVAGLALAGGALGVVGLVAAVALQPWVGLPLAAVGLGIVGVSGGLWLGPRLSTGAVPTAVSEAETWARRYQERGHPRPTEWSVAAVEAQLGVIEEQLRGVERVSQAVESRRRWVLERQRAEATAVELQAELGRLAASLGLAADLPALGLIVQAERVRALAEARADLQSQQSRRAELARQQAEREARLSGQLRALGAGGSQADLGASGLQTAVRQLKDRAQVWTALSERVATAQVELERARAEAAASSQRFVAHLAACGLAPDQAGSLTRLMADRTAWETARGQVSALDRDIAELERTLPSPAPDGRDALISERQHLEHLAADLGQLHDEISTIRKEIRDATEGRSIQEAIAAREAALDELVADRDAHVGGHALAGVAAWLRGQRRQGDAPAVLDRARSWFLRFTRNRYQLLVEPGGGFAALDTHTDRRQKLSELSDGTRIQLLLSARLAFVEHSEQGGEPTPLFLDEVLSTADPQRFGAVAMAILELASAGRQVWYATADVAELHAWQEAAANGGFAPPQVVEIGPRSTRRDWTPPPTLPTPARALPDPGEHDAITYTAALGLARPGLYDAARVWPLALVLHDRLDAAHRAAESGLRNLGQLELVESGVPLPLDPADVALARARGLAIGALLEAMRVGRGRPVTWEDVARSGVVSPTFEAKVMEQLARHGHDAAAFLEAVRQIPRFRTASLDELRNHLDELGLLDQRAPLALDEMLTHAHRASRDALAAGVLSLAEIEALAELVREVVRIDG